MQAMTFPTYTIDRFTFDVAQDRLRAERKPKTFTLRTETGGFDNAAILARAHQLARRISGRYGLSYRDRMRLSLTNAWSEAWRVGKPYSTAQADRRWPTSRLLASVGREVRL
jgi:hypothetical protein